MGIISTQCKKIDFSKCRLKNLNSTAKKIIIHFFLVLLTGHKILDNKCDTYLII